MAASSSTGSRSPRCDGLKSAPTRTVGDAREPCGSIATDLYHIKHRKCEGRRCEIVRRALPVPKVAAVLMGEPRRTPAPSGMPPHHRRFGTSIRRSVRKSAISAANICVICLRNFLLGTWAEHQNSGQSTAGLCRAGDREVGLAAEERRCGPDYQAAIVRARGERGHPNVVLPSPGEHPREATRGKASADRRVHVASGRSAA